MNGFVHKHFAKIRLVSKVIFLFLVSIISYIAFLPNYDTLPELTSLSDILNHFIAFYVLALFLDFGFSPKNRYILLILCIYGLFIECIQCFLPNRSFDVLDLVVDLCGVIMYLMTSRVLRAGRLRRS